MRNKETEWVAGIRADLQALYASKWTSWGKRRFLAEMAIHLGVTPDDLLRFIQSTGPIEPVIVRQET